MIIKPQKDYALIDSGDCMKLERYGDIVLARPDPQAIWPKRLDMKEWDKADATFVRASGRMAEAGDDDSKGKWHIRPDKASKLKALKSALNSAQKTEKKDGDKDQYAWPLSLGSIKIFARLTPFKHTGIFPEQFANWQWMEEVLQKNIKENKSANANANAVAGASLNANAPASGATSAKPRILNLFGYSGGASVVCAKAGAEVTHVDASRAAISWAKENMTETGLDEKAIRWILEDAVMFVKRELRRGNRYEGIIMDPPVFGRGAKGEVWKIERDLQPFLEMCFKLLSNKPLFFVLNGYASGYSSVSYANNLMALVEKFGGQVENGELLIEEDRIADGAIESPTRYLPSGIVARWKKT